MKIARVRLDGKETYGIVNDKRQLATMQEIRIELGMPIPPDIIDFCFRGWIDELKQRLDELSFSTDLTECRLLSPIPRPPKIICCAFNYPNHATKHTTSKARNSPVIVMKPATTLCGDGDDIITPSFISKLDYETELAVIIGKKTKNVSVAKAPDSIFGYMILNDVTARDIQFSDGQFTRSKSFDTFAPCGPWITTKDEIVNSGMLQIKTYVNGTLYQDAPTSQMISSPEKTISDLSYAMTLEPGDVISTGTPGGTVLDRNGQTDYLKDRDVIVSEISLLGKITNMTKFVS